MVSILGVSLVIISLRILPSTLGEKTSEWPEGDLKMLRQACTLWTNKMTQIDCFLLEDHPLVIRCQRFPDLIYYKKCGLPSIPLPDLPHLPFDDFRRTEARVFAKDFTTVNSAFATINSHIESSDLQNINATFQFFIEGKQNGKYYIDLKHPPGYAGPGETVSPDVMLRMNSDVFLNLVSGQEYPDLHSATSIEIKGNIALAVDLYFYIGVVIARMMFT